MPARDQVVALVAKVARRAPDRIVDTARLGDLGVGSSIAIGILDARLREELGSAPAMTWKSTVGDVLAHFDGPTTPPPAFAPAELRRASPTPPTQCSVSGVGLDVESVSALPELGDPFYVAHFTKGELDRAAGTADAREHLAGIWAAKEATRKSLAALAAVPFTAIEIRHDASGRPSVVVAAAGRARFHVSISHAAGLATAIVIAVD